MQTPYQRWYETHKEEFNRRRREKYRNDPNYRDRMLGMVRAARVKSARPESSDELSLAKLAEYVDKTTQTLREWEAIGLFPRSVNTNGYRVYSRAQADLIKELSDAMSDVRYQRDKSRVDQLKAKIWENWSASQNSQ